MKTYSYICLMLFGYALLICTAWIHILSIEWHQAPEKWTHCYSMNFTFSLCDLCIINNYHKYLSRSRFA